MTLKIYNIPGQVVATIVNEVQTAGYKSVEWNANDVASGVYFYRIDAANLSDPGKVFLETKKMVLIY